MPGQEYLITGQETLKLITILLQIPDEAALTRVLANPQLHTDIADVDGHIFVVEDGTVTRIGPNA